MNDDPMDPGPIATERTKGTPAWHDVLAVFLPLVVAVALYLLLDAPR